MNPDIISYLVGGGGIIAIFFAVLKNNGENHKRVSRVYERLDEVKKEHDEKYVFKDVCFVQNKSINDKITKLDRTQDVMNGKMDKLLLKNNIK